MTAYKETLCAVIGAIGGAIAAAFGGWNSAMTTLLIFMGLDYVTGNILACMGKSGKSETGALNSYAGWKGLMRKGMTLAIVYVAYRLDLVIGTTYIKDAAIITFATNEALSITENAGALGVPMPAVVTKAIEVLKTKGEKDGV